MGKTINKQLKEIADHYGKYDRLKILNNAGYDLSYACSNMMSAVYEPTDSDGSDNNDHTLTTTELTRFIESAVKVEMLISQIMYLFEIDPTVLAALKAYNLFIETKQIEEQEMTASGQ